MDKEKMIEEMARDMCCTETCNGCPRLQRNGYCVWKFNAEILVANGYRKIPEGSVVLTKEEYNKLNNRITFGVTLSDEKLKDFVQEEAKNFEIDIDKVRKETGKQSCNDLIKIIKNNTDLNASVFGWTTDFILNMIKTYFKETFGVEVE